MVHAGAFRTKISSPGLGHRMEHQLNRLIQREQEAGHFRDGHGQYWPAPIGQETGGSPNLGFP